MSYIVTVGRKPGIYMTWHECEQQISGFPGAKFFKSKKAAILPSPAIFVDAACSKPPGPTEYRGILFENGVQTEIFHSQLFPRSTNNIGEYLAIVEALSFSDKSGRDIPIYSDSQTGIKWALSKNARTTCTTIDPWTIKALADAKAILNRTTSRSLHNIKKWDTATLGEIPADFGRK